MDHPAATKAQACSCASATKCAKNAPKHQADQNTFTKAKKTPSHHPFIIKTSQHHHHTHTGPKHHQKTNKHRDITKKTETRPRHHRDKTETTSRQDRDTTETWPWHHRDKTGTTPRHHQKKTETRPRHEPRHDRDITETSWVKFFPVHAQRPAALSM